MTPLSHLTAIRLGGEDAGQFLHDQVSADVLGLEDGQSTLACYCEPKGRVLALLLIIRRGTDYIVVLARELAAAIVARLKIFIFRARVSIEECGQEVGLIGPGDSSAAPEGLVIPLDALPGNRAHSLLLGPVPRSPEATDTDASQWRFTELRHGVAWLGAKTSGQFLPQMLGFDRIGAVNYKKGCYPGQEIVARTHYLGKVKRHPRILVTEGKIDPEPMDKIELRSGAETYDAVTVDSAHDADGNTCILCVTRMSPEAAATAVMGSAVLSH
ncbi:MAG: hypothetical protein PVF89_03260 [Lysobacterales bacterium]